MWCLCFGFRGTEDAPAKEQLAPEHWTKIIVEHAANPRRHASLSDGIHVLGVGSEDKRPLTLSQSQNE